MFQLNVTDIWKETYPGATMGILVVENIANVLQSEALEKEKRTLEGQLQAEFSTREEIKAHPVLRAYAAYYKLFKKNYHVFFQLESVAVKGKPIPRVNALVEAMFMAELKHYLLTAGHDLDILEEPLTLDIAKGNEIFTTIAGREQPLKEKDMHVADSKGVISSVIYGPDKRTRITEKTKRALFTVYVPAGIEDDRICDHLEDIFSFIKLFSPGSRAETMAVMR